MTYDNNTAKRINNDVIKCFETVVKENRRLDLNNIFLLMYQEYGASKERFEKAIREVKQFYKGKVTVHGRWMKPYKCPEHLRPLKEQKLRAQDYWKSKKEQVI